MANHSIDIQKLISGDRRTLAKAITLVESVNDLDRKFAQELLQKALPHSGKSIRVGITGVPGVGKSTFIESFGQFLINQGHKVAVLAVDPSSPISGGSIMGDKTRMEKLAGLDNAFIRPSPSSGALGGVALKTRETMHLCETAGFDWILVETVGVGQSEYEVASMVDFFMVLMLPNAGDELQGIKKGILELADAIVVNKAEDENSTQALRAVTQYHSALHLLNHHGFWTPEVHKISAIKNLGIDDIYEMLNRYLSESKKIKFFDQKRHQQSKEWMNKLTQELLEIKLFSSQDSKKLKKELEEKVLKGEVTAYQAAENFINQILP
ncbi:MAG: methylmalonyl Co-A mutase-associated GTPase MeaB [Bacteriovoracaceae bacterium]|nr:methylmalonyl Co-A mutase-associated GTPase MeaB [Bacteriovoracaceae bacterium]